MAVLLVLVYHHGQLKARPDGLRGGFLGVDVFFVLSGYLITSLLLAERSSTGGIAIGTFWARRARRLLPALFVLLLGAALYSATIAAPSELAQIRGDAIATLFYVQNWHLIAGNPLDAGSVLNHTWSLSVEEQWYIVWPVLLALLLAWKRVRPRRLFVAIVALAAASAIWTNVIYRSGAGVLHVYWGTDTRAQELLIGAALAVALRHFVTASSRRRPVIELAGLVGACVVVAIVLRSTSGSAFFARGGYAIFAVAIAVVIAAAVQPAGAVIRPVLSAAPLRWIGLISYGLYLFHWPLYFWLTPERTHTSGATLLIVRVGVAVAAATASFLLIEQPIRRGALTGRKLRLAACVSLAVVLAATLLSTRDASTPTGADAATASPLLTSRMIATFRRSATEPGRRLLVVGHRLADRRRLRARLRRDVRVARGRDMVARRTVRVGRSCFGLPLAHPIAASR